MQIALTKKLTVAMGVKPSAINEISDPIFSWTANWTNTFDRRKEDMVVMVNNATRFTVTIFGVKRNQFKDIATKMTAAIRNTLLAMNLNTEVIDEYLRLAGEIEFTSNHDRKLTAWVNRQGLDAAFVVGNAENESEGKLKFNDTLGHVVSRIPVNYSNNNAEGFIPDGKMINALTELTGKPAYKYRAFELLVTLDLEIYKATRRLIVPVDLELDKLHKVLQRAFNWKDYHLYDFAVFDGKTPEPVTRLVPDQECLLYDNLAVLTTGHMLSEYFPKYSNILYTYDMGDNWEHTIELVRVIEAHNEESPYLLEVIGQTPPEDVGGVGGFMDFRKIMLDPTHPSYLQTKEWAGYWSPELREWDTRPKAIYY